MKYIRYSLLVIICVFSFYFSDKVILLVENQSPIMKEIKSNSKKLSLEAVDAIIEGNTIIPGISGKKINERESYLKMNDFGTFNETFYVYDTIKPKVSLYDNLDKVIIKGRSEKLVSILSSNEKIVSFLKNKNVKVTKILNGISDIDTKIENINGVSNKQDFEEVNMSLKRKKINTKICIIGSSNYDECKKLSYFLVSPSKRITKSNLVSMKVDITGGDIIFLSDSLSETEVNIILKEINFRNLDVVYLSELIKE